MGLPALMHQVKQEKNNPTFLYWFGKRLNDTGQYKPASVVLSRACNLDENSVRLRAEWTKALLGTGMVTSAFNQLKQFVGTHPALADAHFLLGRFYYTQNSMTMCEAEMKQAVKLNPSSARSWAYLSGAEVELREHQQALRSARRAVALDGSQPDYHVALGMLLQDNNRLDDAQAEFAKASALAPRSEVPQLALARLFNQEGKYTDAATQARAAVNTAPHDSRALLIYGTVLLHQNEPNAALVQLQRAAVSDPYNAETAWQLSLAYRAVHNDTQADYCAATHARLLALKTAILDARVNVQKHPEVAAFQEKLGNLMSERDDVQGALRHFSAAHHHPADAPQTLDAAANSLALYGHLQEALQLSTRAVQAAAGSPAAHETLGDVYLGLGRVGDAEKEYNSVIDWLPGKKRELVAKVAGYKKQVAQDALAQNDWQKATELLQHEPNTVATARQALQLAVQAAKLSPGNPLYWHLLLTLQMIVGDINGALRSSSKLVAVEPDIAENHALYAVLLAERNHDGDISLATHQLNLVNSYPGVVPTTIFARGVLAIDQHQAQRAVRLLQQAVTADPNANLSYLYLSRAQEMAGDGVAASAAHRKYIQLKASNAGEVSK